MAIPYSRPLAPKVTAPKIPKPLAAGGGRVPAAPKAPRVAANDQFTLKLPFAPGTINQTAQNQYNSDAGLARTNAAMGYPTDASIGTDFAGRGAESNQIYQALAQHLAGIQTADVAQGNAGSAALGQQNAATAATAPHIAGAPAAPPLPTPAVQAVLGSQNAANGNYYGSLQGAAYSAGAQANQKALDAGAVAQQTNDTNMQRTLAQLLSGIETPTARAADMQKQNQGVQASNLQTQLGIYQNDETAKTAAIVAGNKNAYDQAVLKERSDEAQWSNATKTKLGIAADKTKIITTNSNNATKTQLAKTKAANGGQTASGKRQALTQAIKLIQSPGGTKTTVPTQYTVMVQPPTPTIGGKVIPGTPTPSSKSVPISAADYASGAWKSKLPKGWTVVAPPVQSKTTTSTINKPGSYTKYNRAVAYLKQTGYSDAEARRALRQWKPKAAS